jgi:ABC-type multidrug transport system ATPase subunit
MSNQSPLLELKNISKKLGHRNIISDLSLTIGNSSTTLITGENGAGKTTLLKIAANLLSIDSGVIHRNNLHSVYYVGNSPGLYSKLSVLENLLFFSNLNQLDQINTLLNKWGLHTVTNTHVGVLSKGQQIRLALLIATSLNNKLIILDEPSAFLDDTAVNLLVAMIDANLNQNSFLIATHDTTRLSRSGFTSYHLKEGKLT